MHGGGSASRVGDPVDRPLRHCLVERIPLQRRTALVHGGSGMPAVMVQQQGLQRIGSRAPGFLQQGAERHSARHHHTRIGIEHLHGQRSKGGIVTRPVDQPVGHLVRQRGERVDGDTAGHGLRYRQAEPLVEGGANRHGAAAIQAGKIAIRHEIGQQPHFVRRQTCLGDQAAHQRQLVGVVPTGRHQLMLPAQLGR